LSALLAILILLLAAGAVGYLLLEKRPGYSAWYGLAKLTGSRLDIGPVDWATLKRHRTPNDALVCPAGHCPYAKADDEPKVYAMAPADLLARLRAVARAEPDVVEQPCEPNRDHTARFIQYTRLMRFPDTIDVEAIPVGNNQSTLAIYSRSLVGRKDFGVNRARLKRWFAALDQAKYS
jgi:uncharacterized protein (DUF1499 family)